MLVSTEYRDQNAEDCDIIQCSNCKEDIQAAQVRLLERNQGLAAALIKKMSGLQSAAFDEDDMLSCANMGILRAAKTYNPTKGAFSTYAWQWMREIVDREGTYLNKEVKIPLWMRDEMCRLAKQYGVGVKDAEFRDCLVADNALDYSRRRELISAFDLQTMVSMNMHIKDNDGDGSTEFGDFIESEDNTEEEAIGSVFKNKFISEVEKSLSDKELWIIKHRFGFEGDPQTLEWCGEHYPWGKVTRERARQVESKAIRKLRVMSKKYHWADSRM